MDALIVVFVALVLCVLNWEEPVVEENVFENKATKLNPNFYVDEDAFMEVAHGLGFGNTRSGTVS